MNAISIERNIVPLGEFKAHASQVLRQLKRDQRPVVISSVLATAQLGDHSWAAEGLACPPCGGQRPRRAGVHLRYRVWPGQSRPHPRR